MTEWSNWSGIERTVPKRGVTPHNAAEIAVEVRRAREQKTTVKMVGAGHSFTAIALPEHTIIRPDRLTGIIEVDRDAMTVTAAAGTRLKHFNAGLEALGLSLHNMGDIAEQTLAGAISTGTHGTGGTQASIAAQVVGLELVTGTGEVIRASAAENPDIFEFARIGLGALGIITTITFAVEPLFLLEATEAPMSWDEALSSYDEMTASSHHVDLYWFPHTDRLMSKRNVRLADEVSDAAPLSSFRSWLDDDFLSNRLFGLETRALNKAPRLIPNAARLNARMLGPRTYSDIAHKVFVTARDVRFKEMEYAVPREAGLAALREVRRELDASKERVSFPIEIRCAPADDIPMSTASGRDSFYLAFHTQQHAPHASYFALMEEIMRAHDGRPHWGKLHTRQAFAFAELYPRFDEFIAMRDRLDPDRVFANGYLRRVLDR